MKKLLISILLITICLNSFAGSIVGSWYGALDIQGTKLRINFHVEKQGNGYMTLMDSPDQGAKGIPTTSTTFKGNVLVVKIKQMGVIYKGTLANGKITGTFTQGGMDMPLVITQKQVAKHKAKPRPQDPVKPYDYDSQEITFINSQQGNIKLAGTLTLPKTVKNPAVVIMITGSGGQNRDEEVAAFNHRPFLVWSDYLTKHGIAVLRFDDRGVGESQGTQKDATSADFATDVQAAFSYLKTRGDVIDTTKIGLIGHSEGGFIAPMVAAENAEIAFIVLLAGTGINGGDILITQTRKSNELAGEKQNIIDYNEKISKQIYTIVSQNHDSKTLKAQLEKTFNSIHDDKNNPMPEEFTQEKITKQIDMISSAWLAYFIRSNPDDFLSKVQCPTLAINGALDFQVIADLNLNGIEKSLIKAGNKDYTIKKIEGLNHLFQEAKTGALNEYRKIKQTVSPKALKLVTDWINNRFSSGVNL